MASKRNGLGDKIKERRVSIPGMTLRKLSDLSGVSSSHLGRVERGERFPSARILRDIAGPLGFPLNDLFALAGIIFPQEAGSGFDLHLAQIMIQELTTMRYSINKMIRALKKSAAKPEKP